MRKKNKITEQKIIYRYLNKLNFNKSETFNFNNDAAFLKKRKNKEIVVTNDTIVESVDFFKSDPKFGLKNWHPPDIGETTLAPCKLYSLNPE